MMLVEVAVGLPERETAVLAVMIATGAGLVGFLALVARRCAAARAAEMTSTKRRSEIRANKVWMRFVVLLLWLIGVSTLLVVVNARLIRGWR